MPCVFAYPFAGSLARVSLSVVAMLAAEAPGPARGQERAAAQCRPDLPVVSIPELPEASGLAVSRRVPGRLWAHNDSGQPILYALDARGSVTGQLRLSGAAVEDWEAMAVGPCGGRSCLYVGDIGDNDARRKRVTVYRLEEPAGTETSAAVQEVFHAIYPDGAHDAEALLVTSDGLLFVVTKGETGPIAVYRFPRELRSGETHRLERVGEPHRPGRPAANGRITDGAVSPDGESIVLRTRDALTFHRAADLLSGTWGSSRQVDVKAVGEPQGEGVAFGDRDTVYLTGEGGGKKRPGTFARLTCTVHR